MVKKGLTIVISGPPGAGSSSVARALAKKLGLEHFSPGKVFKSHSEARTMRALRVWGTKTGKSKEFHRKIDEEQAEKARKGNIVICGKLSVFLLRDVADLKVWIDSPLEIRARRVARREGISVFKALEKVKKREEIERREWKKMYGFDYFDSKKFADLVIDSSRKNQEEIAEEIAKFVKKKFGR
jgi:cytidylate kinase